MTDVRIVRGDVDGVDVVHLEGELDLTNADVLTETFHETSAPSVVLDLTGVTFLDSMAVRALDAGHRNLVAERRDLVIVSPPDTPAAWTLRVAGLADDLVRESLDAALASVASRRATDF
jgi:anti-anti-sigma factor